MMTLALVAIAAKPSPDQCIELLQEGNSRFSSGRSTHSHTNNARLIQAGSENQGDHAYATVIACSDSRVPVERIFDAGVMDIFTIRVAGNVCDIDEVGSIEYGLAHVNTPVMVVLGHTQCGAVTAVTHAVQGKGHDLEINIPPLVDNIQPAVETAMEHHHGVDGDEIIPYAIEENVWQGIRDLFMKSPATRDLVEDGKVKVVGAIYDVGTGKIEWLPLSKSNEILREVNRNPRRQQQKMAGSGGHGAESSHGETTSHGSTGSDHGSSRSSESYDVDIEVLTHIPVLEIIFTIVLISIIGLVAYYGRKFSFIIDENGKTINALTIGTKLILGFGTILLLLLWMSYLSISSISVIGEHIKHLDETELSAVEAIAEIESKQLLQDIHLERAFRFAHSSSANAIRRYEENVEKYLELAEEVDNIFEETIEKFLHPVHSETEKVFLEETIIHLMSIADAHKRYEEECDQYFDLIASGNSNSATELEEIIEAEADAIEHELVTFMHTVEAEMEDRLHDVEKIDSKAKVMVSILALIAIITGLIVAVMIATGAVKHVNTINEMFNTLAKLLGDGKLTERGNVDDVSIDYKQIVVNFNNTVDAVVDPLNVAVECVDAIAKGKTVDLIEGEYKGDFNILIGNLNSLISAFENISDAAQRMALGDLDVALEMRSKEDVLMESLQDMISSMKEIVGITEKNIQR